MNFNEWFDQSDMPEIVNGQWVDLETGIPFAEWQPAKRTAHKPPRHSAANRRKPKSLPRSGLIKLLAEYRTHYEADPGGGRLTRRHIQRKISGL